MVSKFKVTFAGAALLAMTLFEFHLLRRKCAGAGREEARPLSTRRQRADGAARAAAGNHVVVPGTKFSCA
jgi:hypothetical protein